jgi:hypothetical protein
VIFFTDHLPVEGIPSASLKKPVSDNLVAFPSPTLSDDCTKEKIGKLVDKLMSLPSGEAMKNSVSSNLTQPNYDDPLLVVASKILDGELR